MNKHSWLKDMVLFSVAFLLALNCFAWNGSGTYEDPWQIASGADIAAIAQGTKTNSYSGKYFIQTADISFVEGYTWEMYVIGQLALDDTWYPFSGSYDGDGYEVQGLNINASTSQAVTNAYGLFGYCENATIENVTVRGSVKVNATYNAGACVGVGGVAGFARKCFFVALHNYVDIDAQINSAPTSSDSNGAIYCGVGGAIGLFRAMGLSNVHFVGIENHGRIYVHGANGKTIVGGCLSVDHGSVLYFDGANNYGEIVVSGQNTSGASRNTNVGGILSFHSVTIGHYIRLTGCSNFADVLCSNSVNMAGIGCKGVSYGNNYISTYYCTNYADIVKVNNGAGTRHYTAGICVDLCEYMDFECNYNVNFGGIKAFGNGNGNWQLAGIYAGQFGSYGSYTNKGNKNFGDISAVCPNANSIIVGGVSSTQAKTRLRQSQNYGNISVDTKGSVLIGGVASMSASGKALGFLSDCVNLGGITASGNVSTNYSPCVGGVFASTRLGGRYTRDIVISNCYSLGKLNLNLNSDTCYGAIYGVANTFSNYAVRIKNCYAVIGDGQPLIGAVDASNGQVSLENCVGIVLGKEGKVAASVTGSNNWSQAGTTIVSYADGYKTPSLCDGNITSGFFTQADKTAAPYDLILPINLALFPTQTDDVKALHNFTKALGFKRYKRINR